MAKVRIRKAGPGETAGYYNKTAMYLKKAQMGAEVQPDQAQGQSQEDMTQAYYQYAEQQLSNEVAPDKVYTDLVSNGLPEEVAYQIITSLMDKLVDDGVINPDYKREKESQEQPAQEEAPEQQMEAAPEQQQEDQSMFEEDQAAADAEEDYVQDRSYMQDGGYTNDDYEGQNNMMGQYDQVKDNTVEPFNFEELINKTPGIQPALNFPSLGEYIPDYQNLQWSNMDALQSEQSDENSSSQLESQRVGGMVKKKQFVKNVMSMLKKQDGGDNTEAPEEQGNQDTSLGKGNPMDTMTEDVQKHKNNFLNAVKTKATTVKTEEMYDKLKQSNDPSLQQLGMQEQEQPQEELQDQPFQIGGMTGGQDPLFRFLGGGQDFQEDPGYYEADFLPEAKYGYSIGNLRRAQKGETVGWDGDPGFNNNPATGKPRKHGEQAMDAGQKFIDEGTKGMSKRQKEAWIQQQLLLRQQQQQPRVNAQGVPIASVNYVPNYVTGPGSSFRSLAPWNPMVKSQRSVMQTGNPYMYGTNTPYMDPLTGMKPIARQVTKRGIFGRPKRYTDIYSLPGNQPMGDIIADGDRLIFPDRNSKGHTNLSLLDNPHGEQQRGHDYGNLDNVGMGARADIRQGTRQLDRNARRIERNPELAKYHIDNLKNSDSKIPLQYLNAILGDGTTGAKSSLRSADDVNMTGTGSYSETGYSPRVIPPYSGPMTKGTPPDKSYFESGNTGSVGYDPETGFYAYGGYIPKAQVGLNINNPNDPQPAPANPDLALGNQPGLIGQVSQGPNTVWSQQQSFNAPAPVNTQAQAYNSNPANNMATEPLGDDLSNCTEEQKKDPTSKCYKAGQNNFVGLDYATGKSTTVDPEAINAGVNAGIAGITRLLNRPEERAREKQMYENNTTDNLYAAQATKKRGEYVDFGSQLGQYEFDKMGQDRSGFSSYGKYGGYMQDGGELDYLTGTDFPMLNTDDNSGYSEGDEMLMSEDDIKDFMAKGGEIEYI